MESLVQSPENFLEHIGLTHGSLFWESSTATYYLKAEENLRGNDLKQSKADVCGIQPMVHYLALASKCRSIF